MPQVLAVFLAPDDYQCKIRTGIGALGERGGMKTVIASGASTLIAAVVVLHEWAYHQQHQERPGVSGVLALLALAVALTSGSVFWHHLEAQHREDREREQFYDRIREDHARRKEASPPE